MNKYSYGEVWELTFVSVLVIAFIVSFIAALFQSANARFMVGFLLGCLTVFSGLVYLVYKAFNKWL